MIANATPTQPPSGVKQLGLPEHISPSAAKGYLGCSLRFYFERVACIPRPTAPALHLGKAVHRALQAFHLARWRGQDDSVKMVTAAYEEAFVALERDEGPVATCRRAEYNVVRSRSVDHFFISKKSILFGLRVAGGWACCRPPAPSSCLELALVENPR